MTQPSSSGQSRPGARVTIALLASTLLIGLAGCGSQASDEEIAEALAGPAQSSAAVGTADTPGPLVGGPAIDGTASSVTGQVSTPSHTSDGAHSAKAAVPASRSDGVKETGQKTSGAANAQIAVVNKSVVKIGTIGPFSGVLGAITEGGPKTLLAWAAYTSANGGVNGHPIRVIVGDDQADPATSLTLARRMVEHDKVIAMVGNVNVFGFAQIEKYLREKNIPMIGGDGADPGWYQSTTAFPVSTEFAIQIIKGIQYLVDKGSTKIGVLYCLEVAALCTYFNQKIKESSVGKYVVESFQVSLVAPSYTSQCLRMKQAAVDGIVLIMDTAGAARAAQNCATQGLDPPKLLLGLDATKDAPSFKALQGITIPAATAPTRAVGLPAIDRFRQIMATYGPTVGESGIGSMVWASAEMFAKVATKLPDNPTSADLFPALWKIKGETLGGLIVPVTYVQGKPVQIPECMFLWGISNGQYTAPIGTKTIC